MELSDVGAERAVLSGICQYGLDAYIDVSDIITANTFTQQYNQTLYRCLASFFDRRFNLNKFGTTATAYRFPFTS